MRRSFWIVMTLLTRPMTWLFFTALLGVGMFFSMVSTSKYESVDVGVIKSSKPIRTMEQLQQAVAAPGAGAVEIDWGALAYEQLDEVLPRPQGGSRRIGDQEHQIVNQRMNALVLPRDVDAIRTHGWGVGQSVVDRLAEISTLKRLGFLVSYNDENLDLSPLARLQQLQVLDLGIISNDSVSLAPLLELPRLETLALGSHQWVSKQRMAEVAKLPALKTLFLPDVSENQRAMEALSELEHSGSLKQIRIAIPLESPDKLSAVQALTPKIDVGSSKYFPPRIYALIAGVWTSLIFGSLGMHFVGQMSLPAAQLAPEFQAAHQRVLWGIVALIVAGLTIWGACYGANWLPFASIVGLCLVVGVGEQAETQLRFGESPGRRRLSGLLGVAVAVVLIGLTYTHPIVIEEYLMSRVGMLPILFLAIASIVVYRTTRAMNRLCRAGIEAGRPVMLSLHDIQRVGIELQNRGKVATSEETESVATEPFARYDKVSTTLAFIALAAVVVSLFLPESVGDIDVRRYAGLFCAGIAFWSLSIVGAKWWQRMPYISAMMTRPPRRSCQIDDLFQGVRQDLIRLLPVAIAIIFVISHAAFFAPQNLVVRLLVSGLFVASVTLVCYATIMWALVIRSVWGVAILCFCFYFGISVLVAGIAAAGMSVQTTMPTYRVVIAAAVLAAIAIAATTMARRYFQSMEWGRFA